MSGISSSVAVAVPASGGVPFGTVQFDLNGITVNVPMSTLRDADGNDAISQVIAKLQSFVDTGLTVKNAVSVERPQGSYTRAALNGEIFHATNTGAGVTLVANNAIGSAMPAAGAAIPVLGLLNPTNSGVILSINKAKVSHISGTSGGSFIWGCLVNADASFTGVRTDKGISALTLTESSKAIVLNNVALAGTTPTVTTLRQIGGLAASATGAGIHTFEELVDGDILVPPGSMVGIFGQAAGTKNVVKTSITWQEIPIA